MADGRRQGGVLVAASFASEGASPTEGARSSEGAWLIGGERGAAEMSFDEQGSQRIWPEMRKTLG
jgi:hypothetical protein